MNVIAAAVGKGICRNRVSWVPLCNSSMPLRNYCLAILSGIFCLSACSPRSVYIPMSHNVPMFDTVRMMKAAAFTGGNHIEAQIAVTASKHIALAGNSELGAGVGLADVAVGWYGCDKNAKWRYELFAGGGLTSNYGLIGRARSSLFSGRNLNYEVASVYTRFYIQPAIGFRKNIPYYYNLHGAMALSMRVSRLDFQHYSFREVDFNQTTSIFQPVYSYDRTYKNEWMYVFEPCLTNTVGRGPFSVIAQLEAVLPKSPTIDTDHDKFSPTLLFSIGLRYEAPTSKLRRKKK